MAASQASQHFACILCLEYKWSINVINNDKCKQSQVLDQKHQNLGPFTLVIFYQIDWALLFQAQYTSKMLGCLRSCQKKTLLFLIIICMRYLGYILGLITGPDQTSSTLGTSRNWWEEMKRENGAWLTAHHFVSYHRAWEWSHVDRLRGIYLFQWALTTDACSHLGLCCTIVQCRQ